MAINVWRRFEEMIKPAAEEVVVVKQVHSNGTVTAETLTGGTVRLRCAIEVMPKEKVFTAAGMVKAKAPALEYFELEI